MFVSSDCPDFNNLKENMPAYTGIFRVMWSELSKKCLAEVYFR